MAFPSTAVWEVRPTAGSDTACGGGFDPAITSPGTDYSQQDAAQYTFSDLASISSLVVASASHNFVAADVGNFMQITAGTGFTTGFYEIVSVAANQATLDRSPGTVGVGGTYFVGGALATIDQANTIIGGGGGTVWVKATGTYVVTAVLTVGGVNSLPLSFIGYNTTRGDGGKVTWTTATDTINLVTFSGSPGYNWLFQNFNFTNTAGSPGACFFGSNSSQYYMLRVSNCIISGFAVGIGGGYDPGVHYNLAQVLLDSCEVTACTSRGVEVVGFTYLTACYIHGNAVGVYIAVTLGADEDAGLVQLDRCVIWGNSGVGISSEQAGMASNRSVWLALNNCAVGANGSHGIELQGSGSNGQAFICINTVIESNGGYGIKNDAAALGIPLLLNNAFRANTSGNYNGAGLAAQPSDITLTAEPFTSPSTGDFSLNATSGGGPVCKQAGYPGANLDIGPIQSAGSGGGGGGGAYTFAG